MAEKIPGWLERLLLPKLSSLEGELKEFRGEVRGEFGEIRGEIKSLASKIEAVERSLGAKVEAVEKRLDSMEKHYSLAQDVAVLKAEVKELRERIPR